MLFIYLIFNFLISVKLRPISNITKSVFHCSFFFTALSAPVKLRLIP